MVREPSDVPRVPLREGVKGCRNLSLLSWFALQVVWRASHAEAIAQVRNTPQELWVGCEDGPCRDGVTGHQLAGGRTLAVISGDGACACEGVTLLSHVIPHYLLREYQGTPVYVQNQRGRRCTRQ